MKREQRRKQLLSHARDVFAEKGYHAAKIDDIVAHANVARGTFYLHFVDKRTVFEELVDDFLARIGRTLIIEFVPRTDSQVAAMLSRMPTADDRYTLEAFERAYQERFVILDAEPIPGSDRRLYRMHSRAPRSRG